MQKKITIEIIANAPDKIGIEIEVDKALKVIQEEIINGADWGGRHRIYPDRADYEFRFTAETIKE